PKPSLLPGLLAATRTGLTPAGDDKLALKITNYISTSNYWVNGTAKIRRRSSSAALSGSPQTAGWALSAFLSSAPRRSATRAQGFASAPAVPDELSERVFRDVFAVMDE
ncbi:MAG: hypothetical protein ACLP8S_14015, partial [Solirubrobacteraceae bacterium]